MKEIKEQKKKVVERAKTIGQYEKDYMLNAMVDLTKKELREEFLSFDEATYLVNTINNTIEKIDSSKEVEELKNTINVVNKDIILKLDSLGLSDESINQKLSSLQESLNESGRQLSKDIKLQDSKIGTQVQLIKSTLSSLKDKVAKLPTKSDVPKPVKVKGGFGVLVRRQFVNGVVEYTVSQKREPSLTIMAGGSGGGVELWENTTVSGTIQPKTKDETLYVEASTASRPVAKFKTTSTDESQPIVELISSDGDTNCGFYVEDNATLTTEASTSPVLRFKDSATNSTAVLCARPDASNDQFLITGNNTQGGNRYIIITLKPIGTPSLGSGFSTFGSASSNTQTNWLGKTTEASIHPHTNTRYIAFHNHHANTDRSFYFDTQESRLAIGAALTSFGSHQLQVNVTDASYNGLYIKLASSQTANAFELRDGGDNTLLSYFDKDGDLVIQSYNDVGRPSAGTAGRIIFNTDDGQLNVDNGTNWTLPDGTVT